MNFLGRAVPRTLERILSRRSSIAMEPIVHRTAAQRSGIPSSPNPGDDVLARYRDNWNGSST